MKKTKVVLLVGISLLLLAACVSKAEAGDHEREAAEANVEDQAVTLSPSDVTEFFSVSEDPSFEQIQYEGETADWLRYGPTGEHYGFEDDYWEGCSKWCAIVSHDCHASASSVMGSDASGISYAAENVINGSRQNAWGEGVPGYGIGEYIDVTEQYTTSDMPVALEKLCIVNGYAANEAMWKANGRVKQFKLYFNGSFLANIQLEDTMQPQYIDITPLGLEAASGEEFAMRFVIADVYPGEQQETTCVTGIELEFLPLGPVH